MLKKYIRQLNPIQENITPLDKIQKLSEAYDILPKSEKDIDSLNISPLIDKKQLKKLFTVIRKKSGDVTDPIALDPKKKEIKVFRSVATELDLPALSKEFGIDLVPGQGSRSSKIDSKKEKPPSGAEWESIITSEYNKLLGEPNFDKEANNISSRFPSYSAAGAQIAIGFKDKLKISTPMTQFGGGGGKSSLSKKWTSWGGTNGTPKTDMYTSSMNISLKKKGGAQLASGVAGETIATFNAALEYLGETREGIPELDRIMTKIEEGFTKLYTEHTATVLGDKAAGVVRKGKNKGKKVTYTKDEEDVIKQFLTTDKFHSDLTKEIEEVLPNLEKSEDFKKWYVFECMSGYKKFNQKRSIASICVEFDDKAGSVSKKYVVTKDGTVGGLSGTPVVSGDIIKIAPYVRLYAAWKTPKRNPYSALRVGLTLPKNLKLSEESYQIGFATPEKSVEESMLTLRGIIHNEIHKDKIANALLNEEMHTLDEFQIIKRAIGKLKKMGKKVKVWLQSLLGKIIDKLKVAFEKIKGLGKEMFAAFFKFIGIELQSVKANLPSDIEKFVYNV